ncbi:hypothetical protein VBD025_04895 [Virgibacillus flavescens]|uniref:hypothetical protein n=1 Tax=Virgibacillus flavescens TaxID=1611422 RepID=UPI003D32E044
MSILTKKDKDMFLESFKSLEEAKSFSKVLYRNTVLQATGKLVRNVEGLNYLFRFAHRFENAGIFTDSAWENPLMLQPRLVAETLKTNGPNLVMEVLSDLRMLAIAKKTYTSTQITAEDASLFLTNVMAQNSNLLFSDGLNETNSDSDQAQMILWFLDDNLKLTTIFESLLKEVDRLATQRPIMVNRIIEMILTAKKRGQTRLDSPALKKLKEYDAAYTGPTNKSSQISDADSYLQIIKKLDRSSLRKEAKSFGKSLIQTGIASPYHATLLQYINFSHPDLLSVALQLTGKGQGNLAKHKDLVKDIIDIAIKESTCQSIYGLGRLLEREILDIPEVASGIRSIMHLPIHHLVIENIKRKNIRPTGVLLAGTISVLGQPLGIGQGLNPTCQSARGISLWSQHEPAYLLKLIISAARDNNVSVSLDGIPIESQFLTGGLAPDLHRDLDPISLLLVPHLDRIYSEMMKRVAVRGEDAHKWVNPAFYGSMVLPGFRAVTNSYTGKVTDYPGFIRIFYATHHPEYNGHHELLYPNPVGIFMTNVHANLTGLHAVSLQRIEKDPTGHYRIYFYNPNNDSDQVWGQEIRCSISENGEKEGESSLLFHQFVSRIYAFHYNPLVAGHPAAIPEETVNEIVSLAKTSWGKDYNWTD